MTLLESQADHENHLFNLTGVADKPPDRVLAFASGLIILFCLMLGALGNLWIVVAVLIRQEMRRNLINLFIASLCLNDLVNLLLNQSMVAASYLAHRWVLGPLLCELMPELNMLLVCVSLWHHALIGLHRYIVVVHNSTYARLNKGLYAAAILAGTRLFGVLLSLSLPLFNAGSWLGGTVYQAKMLRCIYERSQRLRIMGVVVTSQFLPCTIVITCFALVVVFVRRAGSGSLVGDRLRLRREIRITKMFGVVFLLFLAGFLPYGCLRAIDSGNTLGPNPYVLVTLLYAAASCANPLIFGAMNRDIRRQLLTRRREPGASAGVSVAVSHSKAGGGCKGGRCAGRVASSVKPSRASSGCVVGAETSADDAHAGDLLPSSCGRRRQTSVDRSEGSVTTGQESRQLLSVSDPEPSQQQDSSSTAVDV